MPIHSATLTDQDHNGNWKLVFEQLAAVHQNLHMERELSLLNSNGYKIALILYCNTSVSFKFLKSSSLGCCDLHQVLTAELRVPETVQIGIPLFLLLVVSKQEL